MDTELITRLRDAAAKIRGSAALYAAMNGTEKEVPQLAIDCDAAANEIELLRACVDAAHEWSEAVEQGFASELRPDIARARFLAAQQKLAHNGQAEARCEATSPSSAMLGGDNGE